MRTCGSYGQSEANPPSKVKYSRARSPDLEEIEVIGSPMFFIGTQLCVRKRSVRSGLICPTTLIAHGSRKLSYLQNIQKRTTGRTPYNFHVLRKVS